jgi:signal transduction histidine kinase
MLKEHDHRLDTNGLRLLTEISSNAQLMSRLIEDILAFARLGRREIRKTTIDMTALIHTIFVELMGWEDERKVDFTLEDLPPAQGDRTLMQQVLVNLLTNALKFTGSKADAAITLKGWREGNENIYSDG